MNENRYKLPNRWIEAMNEYEKLLLEANELLRSAYSIAQRNGEQTNWEAFRGQLKKALEAQHKSGLTQPAPDAGDSAASSGIVNASADST